jgi:hypothetical protein
MNKKTLIFIFISLLIIVALSSLTFAEINVNVDVDETGGIVKIRDDIYIPANREVNGDVVAIMGDIKVEGKVRGDVVAIMGRVSRGPKSKINGNITEISGFNAEMFANMDIAHPFVSGFFSWGFRISKLIITYGLAVLILALMPGHQQRMTKSLRREPLRKLIIGFISILIIPIIVIVSIVSLIGIPLMPFIMLIVFVAKFIGYVAVALLVGKRIKDVGNINVNVFLELLFGIIILWLLRSIPIIGFISYLVVAMLALGVVIDTKFGINQPWFDRKEIKEVSDSKDLEMKEVDEKDKE